MKIALFSDTFTPQVNGVARTLERLIHHLEHRHVPYQAFVPDSKNIDTDRFLSHVHRLTSLPFFLYPECRMALPRYHMIKDNLESFSPDILHIATPFNIGLYGLYYGKKYNIPLVASYHTHFDRYLQYYNLEFLSNWIWRYMRWFHDPCETIFVPSEDTKHQLINKGFSSVDIWSRGVDCHLFSPNKRSHHIRDQYQIKERYILLYVGRIAPEKDIDVLQEAMMKIPEDLQKKVHWLIVGDGPSLSDWKQNAISNVTFTGYLSGERLAEVYASSDMFVFPSSTETFGNVVLEAMASGLPVIGSRSGGVKELIQHSRTGFLCTPHQSNELAHAIQQLLCQPEHMRHMGKQARQYALTKSWESIFDRLLIQYEQAIHQHHRKIQQKKVLSA
ncbi:MAG: glycosyltransferase family 1 protein [Bacillaceae bacterium]|nr:glycosyltransferase family 1 protein [Bacillaceae bacterium]